MTRRKEYRAKAGRLDTQRDAQSPKPENANRPVSKARFATAPWRNAETATATIIFPVKYGVHRTRTIMKMHTSGISISEKKKGNCAGFSVL